MENRFAWIVENYLTVGSLQKYATDIAEAHYHGFEISPYVWVVDDGDLVPRYPEVVSSYEQDDFKSTTIKVGEFEATYRIDLRA